jgi:monofunctional glycosyltransferase
MKRLILLFLILALLYIGSLLLGMPAFSELRRHNPTTTAFMKAKGGPIDQTWVRLKHINPSLRMAVIAAEDQYFYGHQGVDWDELKASFEKNLKEFRFARGASTISMQVVKNLYLTSKKSLVRKTKEVFYTFWLEYYLSKNRILEIYLNIVEWGPGIYGAEAAAKHYFQTTAQDLTPQQSAYLAALLPNPNLLMQPQHSEWVAQKTAWILKVMRRFVDQ